MYISNTKWTFPTIIGKATKHNIAVGDIVKLIDNRKLYYAKVRNININGNDLVLINLLYEFRNDYLHFTEDEYYPVSLENTIMFKCYAHFK